MGRVPAGVWWEAEPNGAARPRSRAAELLARRSDPVPGDYRVRGLTPDLTHGGRRRMEGIVVITEKEGAFSTASDRVEYSPTATKLCGTCIEKPQREE